MRPDDAFLKRCGWLAEAASWTAGLLWAAIIFEIVWTAYLKRALGYGGGDFRGTGLAVAREVNESLAALCLVGALSALGRVFGKMGKGAVLVADNATGLGRAGEWIVACAIAQAFVQPAVAGVLGVGEGQNVALSWEVLALGLFGGALMLMGDVLRTAARAQTELDGIV